MSALLDVLQRRRAPARPAEASEQLVEARDPRPAPPPSDTLTTPELQLAPEAGQADATPAAEPLPPPSVPGEPGERRWTDREAPRTEEQPVVAATSRPAPPARPAAQRARLPLILTVIAAVLAATLWLGLELVGTGDDGIIADPSALQPAAAEAAAAPPEATPADPQPLPRKRRREAVAWYDQPALPAEEPAAAEPVIRITRGASADPLFDKLSAAHAALVAGDAAGAEVLYRDAMAIDANSVDALLGLGTLAARAGRTAEAVDHYRRAQQLDPRNPTAAAALSALPGAGSPSDTVSRLKTLLREQPDSAALHFALGLHHAAEGNWPDAQTAFFDAVRHEPRSADYAFNLAVSLDRLGQSAPAAGYYRRALDLASGTQQFEVAVARDRLAALAAQ